jgi:NAD(P)-dependent dehydrogenase (short-subunit alcohol dehydrogenase family)
MESAVPGLVVNTASTAAFEGQVGQSDYNSAKGGTVALGLVAARDLSAVGIRVVTHETGGKQVPFPKRMGRAEEHADLVSFLVGNDYVNGETIRIDGAHRFGLK